VDSPNPVVALIEMMFWRPWVQTPSGPITAKALGLAAARCSTNSAKDTEGKCLPCSSWIHDSSQHHKKAGQKACHYYDDDLG
jgi:hypothetical protein